MNRKVLMVSTASRWLGTARMPRSLARAGFEVFLLAPPGSLALHSRFVARSVTLRDESTPMQWLLSLVAMINDVEPCLVVPCDDVAIRLLFELVRNPPRHLDGDAGARIMRLVQRSLGDPAYYEPDAGARVADGARHRGSLFAPRRRCTSRPSGWSARSG